VACLRSVEPDRRRPARLLGDPMAGATPAKTARPGRRDAFRLARDRWRAGERIDMSALARELGVNRVTLYRWVGSREQLLVDVIWNLTDHLLDDVDELVDAQGA